ncbi:MAG TPA: hypothetical protein VD866_28940 [Urbifossiella sp.]|nr:hypothetical protein [Urbifossiella sp.]
MTPDHIHDDELILRHIPGWPSHQSPSDGRITNVNFRLRPDETGYSVSRAGLTTPDALMARLGNPVAGSRIAVANVADIRALGFEVVRDPLPDDPGHAEIRPTTADPHAKDVQRALAALFRYV